MTRTCPQALIASLFICSTAVAQSGTAAPEPIDQIIVTGARTPIDSRRIGSAVTVISSADIERRQARYVADLLRSVPGMAVSHTGVLGSQTQVRVRGAEANHILVLIDGVRANDPATGDEFRWEYLATGNIERIEVIRGPQSALWGSDAIGAVVNIITRGSAGAHGVDVYSETGANNSLNYGATGTVQAGNWLFGAGLESFDTDGGNIARSGSENDGAELTNGSLSARYAGGAFDFSAGLRMFDGTSQTDPVDFFVTGLPVDGDQETRSDSLSADVRVAFPAHDDRVTYHVMAGYYDSAHRNYVDGVEGSSTASERIVLSLQADIRVKANVLSLALEHEDTDYRQRGEIVFGDPNQDQGMQVSSAIAEYQYLGGDRVTWILGGRFDRHSDFEDALTGKVSLAYQLSDETALRASVGTAHKTPTFTERFGFFPEQFVGNPALKPESSTSYDIGVERNVLDGALTLQASIYAQELKDEIDGFVFDPQTFLATAENRDGKSDRSGFELGANWQISPMLSAAATYTYTDAEEPGPLGNTVNELRRPRHSGSVAFEFTSAADRFRLSLVADYGGSREDIFFPPFPDPSEIVTLDSYWVIDATAQFQVSPAFALFVRGTNLLDEDYEEVYGYRTLGRAGYFGFRASFGK